MKKLFNFYLDDKIKEEVTEKLDELVGVEMKGTLASFLRVQILMFLATPNEEIDPKLIVAIKNEYIDTNNSKRSRL